LATETAVTRCKDTENSEMEKENKGKNAEISARIKEIIEDLKLSPNAFALNVLKPFTTSSTEKVHPVMIFLTGLCFQNFLKHII